jgi:tetratricopeptide (TPR) repeat protein
MSLDSLVVFAINGIFTLVWVQAFRYTNNRLFVFAAIWQVGAILIALLSRMPLMDKLSWSTIVNIYAFSGGVSFICVGGFQRLWPYPLLSTPQILNKVTESAKRGDSRRAIYAARQACAKAPRDSYTHFLLGTLLDEVGQPGKALRHLKFASHLSPDSVEIWSELGKTAEAVHAYQEAISAYQVILTLEPDNELASKKLEECWHASSE